MLNKIRTLQEIKNTLNKVRVNKKTGLIAGCFDILHLGHINLFREAKKYVDILVIELENDQNIKTLKGKDRPVHPESYRADMLSELISVDYIFTVDQVFTHDSREASSYYEQIIASLRPDYIFTSSTKDKYLESKKEYAAKYNSQLIEIKQISPTSSTDILNKLLDLNSI